LTVAEEEEEVKYINVCPHVYMSSFFDHWNYGLFTMSWVLLW